MSFESHTTIDTSPAGVWEAIERGWRDAASDTAFHAGNTIETGVEIPDFFPEKLRRKLGDQLLVSITLTDIEYLKLVTAHIEAGKHIPAFDLSLFLRGTDALTQLQLVTSMDTQGSLARKALGLAVSPLIKPTAEYGLDEFKKMTGARPVDRLSEAG